VCVCVGMVHGCVESGVVKIKGIVLEHNDCRHVIIKNKKERIVVSTEGISDRAAYI
jgi:hypothetical protein